MPRLRCVAFVLATLGVGCRSAPRVCPQDMTAADARGHEVWCRSADGKRARWIELRPGTADRKQSCGYVDGKAEGRFSAWHPNRSPWIEGEYRGGVRVGRWQQWNPNGYKVAEGEYRDGTLVAGAPVGIAAHCEQLKP